jgi:hypothetical protein
VSGRPSTPRHCRSGRYATAYRDDELPRVVAKAAAACSDSGAELSRTRFNRLRAEVGDPACPTAERICRRLGKHWHEVVALSLDDDRDRGQLLALTGRDAASRNWSIGHADDALRVIAARFGNRWFANDEYEVARRQMLSEDRRRCRTGRRLRLPTANQVVQAGGGRTWREALERVGLESPHLPGHPNRGLPLAVAIGLCVEAHDATPRWADLIVFARAHHISVSRKGTTFGEALSAYAANRLKLQRGPLPPRLYGSSRKRFAQRIIDASALPQAERLRRPATEDQSLIALADFGDWLASEYPMLRASTTLYRYFQRENREYPLIKSVSRVALSRFGGFRKMLDRADELRRDEHLRNSVAARVTFVAAKAQVHKGRDPAPRGRGAWRRQPQTLEQFLSIRSTGLPLRAASAVAMADGSFSTRQFREHLGIRKATASHYLAMLVALDVLDYQGLGKSRRYNVPTTIRATLSSAVEEARAANR